MVCEFTHNEKGFSKPEIESYIASNLGEFVTPENLQSAFREKLTTVDKVIFDDLVNQLGSVAPNFKIQTILGSDRSFVDFTKSVIYMSENGTLADFQEEVFHILFEFLPANDQNTLLKDIVDTKIYGEVFEEYSKLEEYKIDGRPNINKIKREAVGKLLKRVAQGFDLSEQLSKGFLKNLLKILKDFIARIQGLDFTHTGLLVESILSGNANYQKGEIDLTALGIMYSDQVFKTSGSLLSGHDLLSNAIQVVHIPYSSLETVTYRNYITKLIEAYTSTGNKNYLMKINLVNNESLIGKSLSNEAKDLIQLLVNNGAIDEGILPNVTDNFSAALDDATSIPFEGGAATKTNSGYTFGTTVVPVQIPAALERTTFKVVAKTTLDELETLANSMSDELLTSINNSFKSIRKKIKTVNRSSNDLVNINDLNLIMRNAKTQSIADNVVAYYRFINNLTFKLKTIQDYVENTPVDTNSIRQLGHITQLLSDYEKLLNENKKAIIAIGNEDLSQLYSLVSTLLTTIGNTTDKDTSIRGVINQRMIKGHARLIYDTVVSNMNNNRTKEIEKVVDYINTQFGQQEADRIREQLFGTSSIIKDGFTLETIEEIIAGVHGDINQTVRGGVASVRSFFDEYLLPINLADDPILASIGRFNEELKAQSEIEFGTIFDAANSIMEKVRRIGEYALGKKLTRTVSIQEIRTRRVVVGGQTITQTYTHTEQTKMFVNKFGNYKEWVLFSDDDLVKTFEVDGEEVFRFDGDVSKISIEVALANMQALLPVITTQEFEAYYKKLKEAHTKSKTFFHSQYTDEYNNFKEDLIKSFENIEKGISTEINQIFDDIEILRKRLDIEQTKFDLSDADTQLRINVTKLKGEIRALKYKNNNKNITDFFAAYDKRNDLFYDSVTDFKSLEAELKKFKSEDVAVNDLLALFYSSQDLSILVKLHTYLIQNRFSNNTKELFDFLNEHLNYSNNQDFYKDRKAIFNQMADVNFQINPGLYDIVEIRPNLVLTYEEGIAAQQEFYTEETIKLKGGDVVVYAKRDKYGNYIKLDKVDADGNTVVSYNIGEAWRQIIEIADKYKDDKGYAYDVPLADAQKITKLQDEIYAEQQEVPGSKYVVEKNHYRDLTEQRKQLAKQLKAIQTTVVSHTFIDGLLDMFTKINGFKDKQLIQLFTTKNAGTNSDTFVGFFQSFLQNQEFVDKVTMFKKGVDRVEYLKTGTPQDYEMFKWFAANLAFTNAYEDGEQKTKLKEAYHFQKVIPVQTKHYRTFMSSSFTRRTIKDTYITDEEFKDLYYDYFPLQSTIDQFEDELVQGYKDLAGDEKEIHQIWVEDTHMGKQKTTFYGDENTSSLQGGAFIGYRAPSVLKERSEQGLWEYLKQVYDVFMGKLNPLENLGTSVENEDTKKQLTGFWKRMVGNRIFDSSISELEHLKQSQEQWKEKTIPVFYASLTASSRVTDNVFSSVLEYQKSLIHAKNINNRLYHYYSLRNVLESFAPKVAKYKRLSRIDNYIDQEIYKNNIGSTAAYETALRMLQKLMIFRSQSILNPAGNVKNLFSSLVSNLVRSPNTKMNWQSLTTTAEAFKFASTALKDRQMGTSESFENYIYRIFHPGRNVSDYLINSHNIQNTITSTDLFFVGVTGGENVISTQLMLDYLNAMNFSIDGTYVNYKEAFEQVNGSWKIKDNVKVTLLNGNEVLVKDNYQTVITDVRSNIKRATYLTTGHGEKGPIFANPFVKTLFTLMSFITPLMMETFSFNRRDYVQNRVIENYHVAMGKFLWNSLLMSKNKMWYWNYMTTSQRKDALRGLVLYSYATILFLAIKAIFGYDEDDEDKLKKIKANSNAENFMLYVSLKTLSELETQGLVSYTSKNPVPIISENKNILAKPMSIESLSNILEVGVHSYDALVGNKEGQYQNKNTEIDIKKGDYKFYREIQNMFGVGPDYTPKERFNFEYQLKLFLKNK